MHLNFRSDYKSGSNSGRGFNITTSSLHLKHALKFCDTIDIFSTFWFLFNMWRSIRNLRAVLETVEKVADLLKCCGIN